MLPIICGTMDVEYLIEDTRCTNWIVGKGRRKMKLDVSYHDNTMQKEIITSIDSKPNVTRNTISIDGVRFSMTWF